MDGSFIINLDGDINIHNTNAKRRKANDLNFTYLWHLRLSHIGKRCMKKLHVWWIFEVIWFWIIWYLQILSERKMTKIPFIGQDERATNLLEIIHSDVCSPICVDVCGGFLYFINFHRWFEWIYMGISIWWERSMKYLKRFKEFQREVEKHRNKKIKYLWLDHRVEYLSYEFSKHLKSCETVSQPASPRTP